MYDKVPFNKKAFIESDRKSKETIVPWLRSMGFSVIDHTAQGNSFVADLTIIADGNACKADIEMRGEWHGDRFPFQTVHIPTRKEKYMDAHNNLVFIVVNGDLSHCLICRKEKVTNRTFVKTPRMEEEPFFDVPMKDWDLYRIVANDITKERLMVIFGFKQPTARTKIMDPSKWVDRGER